MANNVFARNPPSRGINQFLRRNHHDYLSQMDDPAMMHSISKFFSEAEAVLGLLEDKFCDQSRNKEVQQLETSNPETSHYTLYGDTLKRRIYT